MECLQEYMFAQKVICIVSDIYKVNGKDWFYNKTNPVDIELTITNWKINVEETESRFRYILNFEIA